jgi:hypothetical protein
MQAGLNVGTAVPRSVRIGLAIATLVAAFTGFATGTYAQDPVRARVTVDFPFVAGGKDMPAGNYEFSVSGSRANVRATSGQGRTVTMTVITRLGRHDADTEAELVFDKADGKSILSELWFPGSDGYLLVHGTADHEHKVVGGSKPHK